MRRSTELQLRYEGLEQAPVESVVEGSDDDDTDFELVVNRQVSESTAVAEYSSPTCLEIDTNFYFECITFQVDGCLFRIPEFLLGAQVVAQIIQRSKECPSSTQESIFSEDDLIMLDELFPEVTKEKFRAFLRVICRRPQSRQTSERVFLTKQQWIDVLELAKLWDIEWVRDEAIHTLSCVLQDPTELVKLGRRFKVSRWRLRGYIALCEREEPLTRDECVKLGVEASVKISKIRERRILEQIQIAKEQSSVDESEEFAGDRQGVRRAKDETGQAVRKAFRLERVLP